MKGRRMANAGLVVVVVLSAGVVAAAGVAAVLPSAQAQGMGEATPEDVVNGFYDWYLGYVDLEGGSNPLVDRAYRSSRFLSADFVAKVDQLLDGFDRGGYDPFLMAQDVPAAVEVGDAVWAGEIAQVSVDTSFEGHALLVTLERADGTWLIDGVGLAPEVVVRAFYERYLDYATGDAGERRNPLVDGSYREFPELSEAFVADVEATIASFDREGYDPILLAQDLPERISVGEGVLANGQAYVQVEMFWGANPEPSLRTVTLWAFDGQWRIVEVGM